MSIERPNRYDTAAVDEVPNQGWFVDSIGSIQQAEQTIKDEDKTGENDE